MPFYEKGNVRIRYEEAGAGYPLLIIAGGGLNSTISYFTGATAPFHAVEEFKGEYRCIASDLRNANGGESTGPLESDRPWDSYTDDQLGVMDHLGIDKFMVMGFCIGGPFIWNLLKRAPSVPCFCCRKDRACPDGCRWAAPALRRRRGGARA